MRKKASIVEINNTICKIMYFINVIIGDKNHELAFELYNQKYMLFQNTSIVTNKNRTITRVRFYKIHNLLLSVACSSGVDI
jgi:hypothetical protein